jgi:transposase InsO family protein
MDNGPEFVALALRGLCHRRGIDAAYIEPGKPWQNRLAESFHARLRDEYLDAEAFRIGSGGAGAFEFVAKILYQLR